MENNNLEIKEHPFLNILVREDGAIYHRGPNGNSEPSWKFGHKDRLGYRLIKINNRNYRVHRLVAETFIPNPENKPTVDHINRIRDDNSVSNLRWATQHEQVENSARVLNRLDYGVRYSENSALYQKNRYHTIPETCRKYGRNKYNRKKAAGLRMVITSTGRFWIPNEIAIELLKLPVSERIYKPKED